MNTPYSQILIKPFGVELKAAREGITLSDLSVDHLRAMVREHHLLLLRGFGQLDDANQFARYCEHWGEISEWPFGKVLELVEHANPEDHIFDHRYVPLHWDGMYRPQVPELQIFQCVAAPSGSQGGETTFANTITAYASASDETKNLWNQTTGTYCRKMAFYDSKTVAPLICRHPVSDKPVIRYNEPSVQADQSFKNHPSMNFQCTATSDMELVHRSLKKALYHPENFYKHVWQTNDIVVADNHALLHGRQGYQSGSGRHLRRVHVLGNPPLDNPHLVSHR